MAAVFALPLFLAVGYYFRTRSPRIPVPTQPYAIPARIFSSSTSEGRKLRVIGAPQRYSRLLLTPDGKKLYAIRAPSDQSVAVFRTADLAAQRVIPLPSPARSAFMSRDGTRIYFGSVLEGVTVVNTATDRPERTIPTRSAVLGLAVSPDNRKLFVAMGNSGLARIDLKTLDKRILSSAAYPYDMGLDGSGRSLYVAYQHGGPGGRWGHDVVEVYDIGTENVSYVIKDLPMVGARPLFAPRGEVVLLSMSDACLSSYYDHVGCPAPPGGGFYLWQPADRRVIATVPLPEGDQIAGFLPEDTRVFFTGRELAVWDWSRQQMLEKIELPEAASEGGIASPRDRVFVLRKKGGILVFEPEKPQCQPPALGLANFYSGDGTLNDVEGTGKLTTRGEARFAAGRIGQAFDFDGRSAPLTTQIAAD
ncbi:MAG: YncE family protein, partial [Bryobacteraceae bacterium]